MMVKNEDHRNFTLHTFTGEDAEVLMIKLLNNEYFL